MSGAGGVDGQGLAVTPVSIEVIKTAELAEFYRLRVVVVERPKQKLVLVAGTVFLLNSRPHTKLVCDPRILLKTFDQLGVCDAPLIVLIQRAENDSQLLKR